MEILDFEPKFTCQQLFPVYRIGFIGKMFSEKWWRE